MQYNIPPRPIYTLKEKQLMCKPNSILLPLVTSTGGSKLLFPTPLYTCRPRKQFAFNKIKVLLPLVLNTAITHIQTVEITTPSDPASLNFILKSLLPLVNFNWGL